HAGGSVGGWQGGRRRQVEAAFHAFEALQEGAGGVVGAGQQHAGADELQDQARVGGAAHGGQALVGDVGQAGQGGRAEAQGLAGHPFELVGGYVQQALGGRVRDLVQDDQVAEAFEQVGGEAAG